MREVYWLEQYETDLPSLDNWLASSELARLATLKIQRRRADWLLGRWTAKSAVSRFLGLNETTDTLATIELTQSPDGAPVVHVQGSASAVNISISHRAGRALCVVGSSGHALGCDLECLEPHSDAFVLDYFTQDERRSIECHLSEGQLEYPSILWSAKEAVLKLLHVGLRMDTRAISVRLAEGKPDEGWCAFRAVSANGTLFRGWWQANGGFARTVAAFPPARPPVWIQLSEVDTVTFSNLLCGKIRAQHAWQH